MMHANLDINGRTIGTVHVQNRGYTGNDEYRYVAVWHGVDEHGNPGLSRGDFQCERPEDGILFVLREALNALLGDVA